MLRVHQTSVKSGIRRSPEFERKGLASFAVNVGRACGHDCTYCSSKAIYRRLPVFKQLGESPFGHGYCIVDPNVPVMVARDAQHMKRRGLVQMCTLTDAWAPECQPYQVGRRCLEALLAQPHWTVRILTKNAAVQDDFDVIAKHRDRVLVGLSITAAPNRGRLISVLEPYASSIEDRMAAMVKASRASLRTYAMFCPLMPGIADSPDTIEDLIRFAVECKVGEVFVEPVNARGKGLGNCQAALASNGFHREAHAIDRIRTREAWSSYVLELVTHVQRIMRERSEIKKLRFLLYPSNLLTDHAALIRRDDVGVVWLGEAPPAQTPWPEEDIPF